MNGQSTKSRRDHCGLLDDCRGTATLDYLMLLVTLSIGAAFLIKGIGPGVVELFHVRVTWLAMPIP